MPSREFAMGYAYTADGLKEFIGYLTEKGMLNSNTAGGMRTAVEKVLSALDEDERQNLKGLDAREAVMRFVNKNPKALNPESIGVYRSRLQKSLEMLGRFNTDPSNFRVNSNAKAKGPEGPVKSKSAQKNGKQDASTGAFAKNVVAPQAGTDESQRVKSVTLTFPLREDFMVQLVIPKDLRMREAKKLAAFLELLTNDPEE